MADLNRQARDNLAVCNQAGWLQVAATPPSLEVTPRLCLHLHPPPASTCVRLHPGWATPLPAGACACAHACVHSAHQRCTMQQQLGKATHPALRHTTPWRADRSAVCPLLLHWAHLGHEVEGVRHAHQGWVVAANWEGGAAGAGGRDAQATAVEEAPRHTRAGGSRRGKCRQFAQSGGTPGRAVAALAHPGA